MAYHFLLLQVDIPWYQIIIGILGIPAAIFGLIRAYLEIRKLRHENKALNTITEGSSNVSKKSWFVKFITIIIWFIMPGLICFAIDFINIFRAERYATEGDKLYFQGKFTEAENQYKFAMDTRARAKYHIKLGVILSKQERFNESEVEFRKAIEKDPNNGDYHSYLGWLLFQKLNNLKDAEEEARLALYLDRNSHKTHELLGLILKQKNEFNQAELQYREAIRLNPNIPGYYLGLADVLFNLNKWQEAEQIYEQGVKLKSNDSNSLAQYGDFLLKMNKADKAEAQYRAAIDLEPPEIRWRVKLIESLCKQKKRPEAEIEYSKANQISPSDTFKEALNKCSDNVSR